MKQVFSRVCLSLVLVAAAALTLLLLDLDSRQGARDHGAVGGSWIPVAILKHASNTLLDEAERGVLQKLALNGALTMGTWDGTNIEIAEAVGLDNIFIFGHRVEQLEAMARAGYRPFEWLERDGELHRVVTSIQRGLFNQGEFGLFEDIYRSLTEWGDPYCHLADFRSYTEAQQRVSDLYRERMVWAPKALLNVARMGHFSNDTQSTNTLARYGTCGLCQ